MLAEAWQVLGVSKGAKCEHTGPVEKRTVKKQALLTINSTIQL